MKRENLENTKPDAVRRLYEVFSSYHVAFPYLGCECCTDARIGHLLGAQPLNQLSAEVLNPYLEDALTVWGDLTGFKHFLPRLLELSRAPGDSGIDLWWLGLKLDYAKWRQWPTEETEAVTDFLRDGWEEALRDRDERQRERWLDWLGELKADVPAFLEFWARHDDPGLRCEFARYVLSGRWQEVQAASRAATWSEALAERLEANFFRDPDGPCAAQFADAADLVRNLLAFENR